MLAKSMDCISFNVAFFIDTSENNKGISRSTVSDVNTHAFHRDQPEDEP